MLSYQLPGFLAFCGVALFWEPLRPFLQLLLLLLPCLFLWNKRKDIFVIIRTLPRDLRFTLRALNALIRVKILEKKGVNLVQVFTGYAQRNPDKVLFLYEEEKWTFNDLDTFSNQVANVFHDLGYRKGDAVALLMSNSPVYVGIWLGLAKIGAVTALINTNLKKDPLVHCLKSGKVKGIIFTSEFRDDVADVADQLPGISQFLYGKDEANGVLSLDVLLKKASTNPPEEKDKLGYRDKILYIYTSGTTGLPKAAIITNVKCLMLAYASWYVLGFKEDDIMYNSLPLYHTSGGVLGIVPAICKGSAVVIRKKFSASQYWADCSKYNCTLGLYIGEMCRYLLAQPPRTTDSQHSVRMLMGNGMRTTVWRNFQDRFCVPQICELYGSTEGNTNLINIDKTVGAVGFLPQFLPKRLLPIDLIRVDDDGIPSRGVDGLCIRCKPGEPGTFVGVISTSNSSQEFAGYVGGEAENKKKILRDVFKRGDQVFWSGDLLVTDELGYIFFKDRLGDTYRWKGENVSAAEVEAIVSRASGNLDATVYGVEVGNLEGRCGMATIVDTTGKLDLSALAAELDQCLPAYARPLFIRLAHQVDMTGTFKLRKTDLQREGFNPRIVGDPVYFRKGPTFVPLTQDLYERLISGNERL